MKLSHLVVFMLCVVAVAMSLPLLIAVAKFIFMVGLVISGAFFLYVFVMFIIGVITG